MKPSTLTIEVGDDSVESVKLYVDGVLVPHVRVVSFHASPKRFLPQLVVMVQDAIYTSSSIAMLKPFPWVDVVTLK